MLVSRYVRTPSLPTVRATRYHAPALSTRTVPGSPFLLYANDINDRGEIAGQAFHPDTNEAPAYVGVPHHADDH